MKADDLKREWKLARDYANLVGEPEPHLRTCGKVHRVVVTTEIEHQASPSAQNYWKSAYFDAALGEVIKLRFPELARHALAIMQVRYEDALRAEKNQLLARLAAIQAIEEAQ
jgi:hypothetical protein